MDETDDRTDAGMDGQKTTTATTGHDGTDGHRTNDDDGKDDGTGGRTEDDDADDGTGTTGRTNDIYSSNFSKTTLGFCFFYFSMVEVVGNKTDSVLGPSFPVFCFLSKIFSKNFQKVIWSRNRCFS